MGGEIGWSDLELAGEWIAVGGCVECVVEV